MASKVGKYRRPEGGANKQEARTRGDDEYGLQNERRNARGEPRPMAGATEERTLLGVGSSAWLACAPRMENLSRDPLGFL